MKLSLKQRLLLLRKLFSDKRHWVRNSYKREARNSLTGRTCYCLAGGLNKISDRAQVSHSVPEAEFKALGFHNISSLLHWNDDPNRKIEDVRKRIDEALAQLNKKDKTFSV